MARLGLQVAATAVCAVPVERKWNGDAMSETDEQTWKIEPAQWGIAAVIAAFAAGAFLYKLLMHEQLGHSAAMFLGVPAVLAILLKLAPRAKTATGGILKGITLALLVVAPLLGEGYLCILMASPLFYVVGLVVGLAVGQCRWIAQRAQWHVSDDWHLIRFRVESSVRPL